MDVTYEQCAAMIDHSLLQPTLTTPDLEAGCRLAVRYNVASVCILPFYLKRATELLAGSSVKPSTTIGFPHGAAATSIMVAEAEKALADGAEELDMVINVSQALSGNWAYVREEIEQVLLVTHAARQKLKVIFENAYLNEEQKIHLCEICGELGVDWAKTSTGFAPSGATPEDVSLMRRHLPDHVQVKAAGGVRDLDSLLAFRALGATRCGASRTKEILDECLRRLGLPPHS